MADWVMGVDGAPAGWVGVLRRIGASAPPVARLFRTFQDALDAAERPTAIAVDMPIGFLDAAVRGGRACEREARARIKGRTSSVFSSPCRAALAAGDYPTANARNRAANGVGLSKQAFMLFPKLREIDAVMTPTLQERVRESHPEVAFATLAGAPMAHNKKTPEGRAERLAVLRAQGLDLALVKPHPFTKKDIAPDDLLDAAVLAFSAERILRGSALRLPADPPRDARGLAMEIVV